MAADPRVLPIVDLLRAVVEEGRAAGLDDRTLAACFTAYGVGLCVAAHISIEAVNAIAQVSYTEAAQDLDTPPAGFRSKGWRP